MKLIISLAVLSICAVCNVYSDRITTWILGDPHVYSYAAGYQQCKIPSSNTDLDCLTTTNIGITCNFDSFLDNSNAATDGTYMNKLTLTFTNGNEAEVVTAITPSAALTGKFDSLNTVVNSSDGTTWLTISRNSYSSSYSSIVIMDYVSDVTILVSQSSAASVPYYELIVIGPNSTALTTATGYLIDGCTGSELLTSRRKRSVEQKLTNSECAGITGSTDSTLGSTTASLICDFDFTYDETMALAVKKAVTNMNAVKTLDTAAFGAAGSKFAIAAQFGLLVGVFNLFFLLL